MVNAIGAGSHGIMTSADKFIPPRSAVLDEHDLTNPPDEVEFDELTVFAAALCEAPICLVSIVGHTTQRFLATQGLDVCETPREWSFCAHAMLEADLMVVPDATLDPRFATNPLVTGAPHIRFYAGAPLVTDEGFPLGSLCIIDSVPRHGL